MYWVLLTIFSGGCFLYGLPHYYNYQTKKCYKVYLKNMLKKHKYLEETQVRELIDEYFNDSCFNENNNLHIDKETNGEKTECETEKTIEKKMEKR